MSDDVINFSDFLKEGGISLKNNPIKEENTIEENTIDDFHNPYDGFEFQDDNNEFDEVENEMEMEVEEDDENIDEFNEDFYIIFNDKSQNFNCEIQLEGAKIDDARVRLLLETDDWNIVLNGEIDSHGNVSIPMRKMSIFKEGTLGTIKMEVIAEDTVFTPWAEQFKVKQSKKVTVKFNESKTQSILKKKAIIKSKPGIK